MKTIDYYALPVSPWTFLGHKRLVELANKHQAEINLLTFDAGPLFAASGGLPLGKRAPQRQAYRLVELERWSAALDIKMHIEPLYFPADPSLAAQFMVATKIEHGNQTAVELTGALLDAVWLEQRNIADPDTLEQIAKACKLDYHALTRHSEQASQQIAQNTQHAIDIGVFGAPWYQIDGIGHWGQDRLQFVEKLLAN